MKKDIENVDDITKLVNAFYTKVIDDATIGYIFKTAANFSLEKHLPIMVSFWNTLLFGVASYKGNPMLKHLELNKNIPLSAVHFKQWLYLWEATINENFSGKNATEAIFKAKSIADLMRFKIENSAEIKIKK